MADLIPPLKPSRSYGFLSIAALVVVAVIALAAAWGALVAVERVSRNAVEHALFLAGEDWAEVEVNGLQVILSGDAPSEAARFAALSAAGHEVDGARVIDQMVLPEAVAIEPPEFSVEMLRNDAGISLIGLIPAETDREALTRRMRAIDPVQPVADFLETAEFPTPEGWENALDFTLELAEMLPRSKISVTAKDVAVEAIAASPDQKREWEQAIRRERPAGLGLALDIRAPLDVISPYIVRFLSDEQGARFDACTAYTLADRNKIVSAGIAAGVKGTVDCTIGLGVPSPDWPEAVARGIQAVRDMGGGSLTFSDADITLIAPADTPQDTYDRVLGELEADLPEVFSLHGVLSEPETGPASPAGTPEFIATLAENGAVQLRGRVASEQDRTIVETLARARFGTKNVYAPLRLDPALEASWAVRTLAGLEVLDQLADGRVVVRPEVVTVTGTTGDKGASAEISRLLSEKLGEAEDFRVNVRYEEALDPIAAMPTPQECVADVNAALARNKITFAPGSAEIERASASTVDRIAEILKTCPDVAMEIGGYTDSQGREEMNQALSQRRAEAVVSALLARRVLTANLQAFGYGEESPIADNDTEEGREANRRIEFSLVGEDLPRSETDARDTENPTIRPPTRPTAPGTDGDAELAAPEEDTDEAAGDSEAPAAVADDAQEAAGVTEDNDVADDVVPGEEASEVGVDGATEASPSAEDDTVTEPDAGADETVTGDTDADSTAEAEGEDDTATTPSVETEPQAAAEETAGDNTPDADPADSAADETDALEADAAPADVSGEIVAPEDGAEPPADAVDGSADDSALADAEPAEPEETTVSDAAEDAADTATDDVAATEVADEMPANAEVSETTGADDNGDVEAQVEPGAATVEPEDAEAAQPTADLAEPAAPEATEAETGSEETLVAAPLDIPAIRPRARPPIVVHPDLEGVRPEPRPADVPDAPTTE